MSRVEVTIRPLMQDLLLVYGPSPTCPQTREGLDWLQSTLGSMPMPTPRPALFQHWRAAWGELLTHAFLTQCLEILLTVFTAAVRAGAWAPGVNGAPWRQRWGPPPVQPTYPSDVIRMQPSRCAHPSPGAAAPRPVPTASLLVNEQRMLEILQTHYPQSMRYDELRALHLPHPGVVLQVLCSRRLVASADYGQYRAILPAPAPHEGARNVAL